MVFQLWNKSKGSHNVDCLAGSNQEPDFECLDWEKYTTFLLYPTSNVCEKKIREYRTHDGSGLLIVHALVFHHVVRACFISPAIVLFYLISLRLLRFFLSRWLFRLGLFLRQSHLLLDAIALDL